MKFFHSVRLRLQLWHGLLLVLALAGFGFTAWELQSANQLGRVDRELEQRMGIIEGAMRPDKAALGGRPLPPREQALFAGLPGQVFYYRGGCAPRGCDPHADAVRSGPRTSGRRLP